MTSPRASTRPRLTCRLVRVVVACADDRPPAFLARHLTACADCQAAVATAHTFDARLRHAARPAHPQVPDDLPGRLIAGVRRARAASEPRQRPRRRTYGLALLAAASAAAVVATITRQSPPAPPGAPAPALAAAVTSPARPPAPVAAVWDALRPPATELLDAAPLQHEAEALYADAKSALGFLALNFLPGSAEPEPGPTRAAELDT